jgi:hypothetical protein
VHHHAARGEVRMADAWLLDGIHYASPRLLIENPQA